MWEFLSPLIREELPQADTWLDLCCGTGSLARLTSGSGFDTTGVDISKHQIKRARQNVPSARFIVGDVRQLALDRKFHVVTCMFDSLNYLMTKSDLLKAFRTAKRHLVQGGIFAFDMNTFNGLQGHWCKTSATHDRDLTLVIESSFDPKRHLGRCLITGFLRGGKLYRRFQEEHFERGYHPPEIDDLLHRAGFTFKRYDGHRLDRPGKRAPRLLYLCRTRGR